MAVEYKDYYKLLGVDRKAVKDDIAKAYKKLARKSHPDLNPNDPKAEERFKELTEAYEVLKDDEKRPMYDQLGSNWQHGQQFRGASGSGGGRQFSGNFSDSGFSDFFDTMFGGGGQRGARANFGADPFSSYTSRPRRGQDIEGDIEISLLDALLGGSRNISLQTSDGIHTYSVNIPAGVRQGARLRLAGKGGASPGGTPGDLMLTVQYAKNPNFTAEGFDITTDVRIMPWQAVLGAKVRVATLEGHLELAVPAGTASGSKLRVRGKGLGSVKERGNLYVRVLIDTPKKLSEKAQELWEALALEAQGENDGTHA